MRPAQRTVPKPAQILEYPPPERPWDVVAIDLLQLPPSHEGSKYVVLAPLKDKTARAVASRLL